MKTVLFITVYFSFTNGPIGCIVMHTDYKKAFELFESASNVEGIYNMGKMYFEGRGVTQNYKKAVELFEIG